MAATGNPSKPRGPRPYHCPRCSEVAKRQAVGHNWVKYPDAARARTAGHPEACKVCFAPGASISTQSQHGTPTVVGQTKATRSVTDEELAKWRSKLLRLLDQLDGRTIPGAGPLARITRLKNEQVIPRKIAALMIVVTETRNAAEYENEAPTVAEGVAVSNAWAAVVEWAEKRGLKLERGNRR